MMVLVNLKLYRIDISQGCKFDNLFFIKKLDTLSQKGINYSLKNSDTFMENLIKLIKLYCRYGQEHYEEVIELAIRMRDIKYIAIFIKSIKRQESAQKILDHIFE